jgi:hypothetical protein
MWSERSSSITGRLRLRSVGLRCGRLWLWPSPPDGESGICRARAATQGQPVRAGPQGRRGALEEASTSGTLRRPSGGRAYRRSGVRRPARSANGLCVGATMRRVDPRRRPQAAAPATTGAPPPSARRLGDAPACISQTATKRPEFAEIGRPPGTGENDSGMQDFLRDSRDAAARLKIVVSPVRVRVSPLRDRPANHRFRRRRCASVGRPAWRADDARGPTRGLKSAPGRPQEGRWPCRRAARAPP